MRLFRKGAEACLYLDDFHGLRVIRKIRVPKTYRHPKIDFLIRHSRTAHEAKLLHDAKAASVSTPTVYDVNPQEATLTIGYIEGSLVRDIADGTGSRRRSACFRTVGKNVARLHNHGIVHGDLTTSNFIVNRGGGVSLIDFGLGEYSRSLEAVAVDVHLLLRSLESSHHAVAVEAFKAFGKGYRCILPDKWPGLWDHVKEIRRRGRYVEDRRAKMEAQRHTTGEQ